jgi:hypothetical protein
MSPEYKMTSTSFEIKQRLAADLELPGRVVATQVFFEQAYSLPQVVVPAHERLTCETLFALLDTHLDQNTCPVKPSQVGLQRVAANAVLITVA